MQEYTRPPEEPRVLIPTMGLRWVESDHPQSPRMALQQCFMTTGGKEVWVDVPIVWRGAELTGEARHD
jgi:hypothetical protein